MPHSTNIIYNYDGSFEGLLCCVFESVYAREIPTGIMPIDEAEISLFPQRYITTDPEKAQRVFASIAEKIAPEAQDLVQCVFLSCAAEKEMMILLFLLYGYRKGRQTIYALSNPVVAPMMAAQRALKNEVHLLLGFVRFSDYDGVLVATITPKNFVLPYLKQHFCTRFACEDFLIFDKNHKAALIYQNRTAEIISLDSLETPQENEEELQYRALWRRFYKTISIAARENPRCRMTHMPKRYWINMHEVAPELEQLSGREEWLQLPTDSSNVTRKSLF